MKKLKSAIIIFILTASILLTGCTQIISEVSGEEPVLDENTDPEEYAVNMFNKVLGLIEEKDSEAIYDLFSKYDRDNYDLMPEIENAVEFFDSEVSTVSRVSTLNEETVLDGYSASAYITTKNKTEYWLRIRVITTGEKEYMLGLEEICIYNKTVANKYLQEYREWVDRKEEGIDEEPPQEPLNGEATVNYCWKPWARKDKDEE